MSGSSYGSASRRFDGRMPGCQTAVTCLAASVVLPMTNTQLSNRSAGRG